VRVRPFAVVDLGAYDAIVVEVPGDDRTGAPGSVALPRSGGRPRIGSVGLYSDAFRVALSIVPASADACLGCVTTNCEPTHAEAGRVDPIALPFAGAMAALVVSRWLTGIAIESAPRGLRLAADAPSWADIAVTRQLPCPLGCRT
jgi:hypothetical protein